MHWEEISLSLTARSKISALAKQVIHELAQGRVVSVLAEQVIPEIAKGLVSVLANRQVGSVLADRQVTFVLAKRQAIFVLAERQDTCVLAKGHVISVLAMQLDMQPHSHMCLGKGTHHVYVFSPVCVCVWGGGACAVYYFLL